MIRAIMMTLNWIGNLLLALLKNSESVKKWSVILTSLWGTYFIVFCNAHAELGNKIGTLFYWLSSLPFDTVLGITVKVTALGTCFTVGILVGIYAWLNDVLALDVWLSCVIMEVSVRLSVVALRWAMRGVDLVLQGIQALPIKFNL